MKVPFLDLKAQVVALKDEFDAALFVKNLSNLEKKENLSNKEEKQLSSFYNNLKEAIEVDGEIDPLISKTIDGWKTDIDSKLSNEK